MFSTWRRWLEQQFRDARRVPRKLVRKKISPPRVTSVPPKLGVPISKGRWVGIFIGPSSRAVPIGLCHTTWFVFRSTVAS